MKYFMKYATPHAIDVEVVSDIFEGSTLAFYLRGDIPLEEAETALKVAAMAEGFEDEEIAAFPVKKERWRKVPDERCGFSFRFIRDSTGRGSFPVTVLHMDHWG